MEWRRGDSNPIHPVSCPTHNHNNSTTKRNAEAEKRGFDEQISTLPEQVKDTAEHEIGAPAVHGISCDSDPDLAKIEAVWPELPEHIKAAIKALVQAHRRG
jgi:uncharacterized Zn finger protein (UPF0148 family)